MTESHVLITGETGSGKELAAQYMHQHSARRGKPLIPINCTALPDGLLESELFGYEKGAFTGAVSSYPGKLKHAQGGTVLFDEIGDMSPYAQAKILRVIETKEVYPLGGRRSVPLDIRIVAATNRDVERQVSKNQFRQDLYFRLNVARVHLPPLRERRDDIPLLIDHFVEEFSARLGRRIEGFSNEAMELILRYKWPGNIRELRNTVERALLSCRGELIDVPDLPSVLHAGAVGPAESATAAPEDITGHNLDDWLADVERRAILQALADRNGVQAHAARKLGISERSLWHRIKKLNIQISRVSN